MAEIAILIKYVVLTALATLAAYVIVRTASFAYFRTRLEYYRALFKVVKEGDDNG